MIRIECCPACRSRRLTKLLDVPYTDPALRSYIGRTHPDFVWEWVDGWNYVVLACNVCGTLFQEQVWDPIEASRFYNLSSHAAYQGKPLKLTSLAHIAQEVLLLRLLIPRERPRVLDYGMGRANWATMALAFGCDVSGVEINQDARAHASARGIRVVEPDQLNEWEYDFVNLDQVLEHLIDPIVFAKRVGGTLRRGGLALFGVPGHPSAHASFRRAGRMRNPIESLGDRDLDALSPLVHLTLFNPASLKRLAAEAGLEFFRPPLKATLASGTLWNSFRQLNRNLYLPFKFWLGRRTRLWFRRA